jgi:hypothetical protein
MVLITRDAKISPDGVERDPSEDCKILMGYSDSPRKSYHSAEEARPKRSAGVSPAVAGASRSRAWAEPVLSGTKECPRDSGRDARSASTRRQRHK